MCDVLIMNRDNTHPEPDKSARECYKFFDPVEVFPDGSQPPQTSGPFWLLRVPGLPEDILEQVLMPQLDVLNSGRMMLRRLWGIDGSVMPQHARQELQANGEYTFTRAQFGAMMTNKITRKRWIS